MRGGFYKKSDTGPSSNSTVAETRVGSGASLYEIAPIKQGCVWRDNNLKAFVSICTLLTRFCTNGAITSTKNYKKKRKRAGLVEGRKSFMWYFFFETSFLTL
jgi:hypothetical protein